MTEIKFQFVDKQSLYTELRPKCGFCNKEVKTLLQMVSMGVRIHCCSECGAVLGVTKEE